MLPADPERQPGQLGWLPVPPFLWLIGFLSPQEAGEQGRRPAETRDGAGEGGGKGGGLEAAEGTPQSSKQYAGDRGS